MKSSHASRRPKIIHLMMTGLLCLPILGCDATAQTNSGTTAPATASSPQAAQPVVVDHVQGEMYAQAAPTTPQPSQLIVMDSNQGQRYAQAAPTTVNPPASNVTQAPAPASALQQPDETLQAQDPIASRWPMRFNIPQGELTVYQPQLTSFEDNKMTGRAAVSIRTAADQEPQFGALWLQSSLRTDRAARTAQIMDVTVQRIHMAQTSELSEADLSKAMTDAFTREPMVLSLDQLIAMVERVNEDTKAVKDLSDTPPKITFVNQPAVLVQFDGEARFTQSSDTNLLQAINTPFFVVLDKQINRYYLKGAGRWYIAREVTGPYLALSTVPAAISNLALASGYQDPEPELAQALGEQDAPAIITATEPTELIWTLGPEELSPIGNTSLLYVANTDSDVILDIDSQKIYVLLSGRWYRSGTRNGPWDYVQPDQLPDDFAKIPANSDKGSVLAHVAGTQMAKDAIADNYVPQTASIDRTSYEQPRVEYDGAPVFEPVQNTRITYAVNTSNAVLLINGRYYVCYDAVWYQSNFTTGPWELCTSVPQEVYLIPPSSPVYPVRYVRIYEVTPTVIYTGYLPGYVGSYVHHGVVVYGTGYRYRPWLGRVYYPRPYTWGFTPRYDPYHSYWGFNVGVNINFGNGVSLWFGNSNRYVPSRSAWFGYGGFRPVYYHPIHRYDRRFDRFDYRNNNRDWDRDNNRNRNIVQNRPDYRNDRDRQARAPEPRRDDLNLYERRRDVVRTNTPGRVVIDRQDRAERIDRQNGAADANPRQTRTDRADNNNNNNDRASQNPGRTTPDRTTRNDPADRVNRPDDSPRQTRGEQPSRVDRTTPDRSNNDRANANSDRPDSNRPNADRADNDRNNSDRANQSPRQSAPDNRASTTQTRNPTPRDRGNDNDVFADEDGNVYRKTIDGWERREQSRWVPGASNNGPQTDPNQPDRTSRTTTLSNNRTTTVDRARTAQPTVTENRVITQDPRASRNNQPDASDNRREVITTRPFTSRDPQPATRSSESNTSPSSRNQTPATTREQPVDNNRSITVPGSSRTANPSNSSRTESREQTDRTTGSLNADYRARIMGDQRPAIYNQPPASRSNDAPASRTPATVTRPTREVAPAAPSPAPAAAPAESRSSRDSSPNPATAGPGSSSRNEKARSSESSSRNSDNSNRGGDSRNSDSKSNRDK